mmetsp:Transcript_1183/g.2471  ORF Transcript_1183/g.2471 Transcript_1183/m.2471 type:complete len:112 (-) Transcript_1183:132-467(-)
MHATPLQTIILLDRTMLGSGRRTTPETQTTEIGLSSSLEVNFHLPSCLGLLPSNPGLPRYRHRKTSRLQPPLLPPFISRQVELRKSPNFFMMAFGIEQSKLENQGREKKAF